MLGKLKGLVGFMEVRLPGFMEVRLPGFMEVIEGLGFSYHMKKQTGRTDIKQMAARVLQGLYFMQQEL